MQPLIQVKNLSAGYRHSVVLHDINLNIYQNDFIGIIGPNGGGKTTLIKCMLQLLKPMKGEIIYTSGPSFTLGYLPQYNSIDKKFPISVKEVILSGLRKSLTGRYSQEQILQADEILAKVELDGLEKRSIEELSGGQLQRALLGRALISNPSVLILDEPNTYIDKHFESKLYELLKEINQSCAILLVSHDINSILQHAHSMAYINESISYCPDMTYAIDWLEKNFNYSIRSLNSYHKQTKCCF